MKFILIISFVAMYHGDVSSSDIDHIEFDNQEQCEEAGKQFVAKAKSELGKGSPGFSTIAIGAMYFCAPNSDR